MDKTFNIYFSPNEISFTHQTSSIENSDMFFWKLESHAMIEIILVVSGALELSINGTIYQANAGDLVVINAQDFHSSRSDLKVPYERFNLHFSQKFIPILKDVDLSSPFFNAHLYQYILPNTLVKKSRLVSIIKKIEQATKDTTKYRDLKIVSLIQDFIYELNITVDTLINKEYHLITTSVSSNKLIQATIDYINDNLQKNLSSADIAQYLGISESHLYRSFKKNLGVALHEYIRLQKMQQALALLRKGHSPQRVSEKLGYEYYTTFFTQFMKVFGYPPSNFTEK